ncbi:MAG TPA: cytochrome P450 [Cystobacter sp.]
MSLLDGFDFLDPKFKQHPYPYFAEMREKAPLFWNERFKSWVLSRHEDVAFALKNAALFSSADVRLGSRKRGFYQAESVAELIASDPPVHTRMRGLVSRAFTPKQISAMEPRVRELSRALITEMTASPEFDFMDGLASPLPVTIIAEMLGIDTVRRRDFKRWSDTLLSGLTASMRTGQEPEEVGRCREEMLVYMTQVAEERRRAPRGDLISLLVQETDGVPALSAQEVNAFTVLLLIAGNETTTNLLGNTLHALIRHPDEYEWLRRDPSVTACAAVCEETLRFDSPVMAISRRTTQEVEVSGGKIPAESTVTLLLGSANHDPRKFPNPERFDPRRDTNGLMSFGHGIHFCLGAPLTRVEAPVALQELMERTPHLGFAPRQPEHLDYGLSFALRGPRSLWLQKN